MIGSVLEIRQIIVFVPTVKFAATSRPVLFSFQPLKRTHAVALCAVRTHTLGAYEEFWQVSENQLSY